LIANGGSCTGGSQAHDDPLFKDQWWLANTGQSFFIGLAHFIVAATGVDQIFTTFHATAGADVRWTEARALNACAGGMCTGSGVTVAVVDSGVDASHPDLQGQVSPASQSFDPTQPSIDDTDGHGTFIAGLIAARAGNGAGIVGIAPQSQILAVKNELTTDSLSRSIRYAAEHGAAVINLSVGGSSPDAVERAAIDYATQAPYNAIVVASAGNDAFEGNPILYPASFPHVISVASIDPDGLQSLFSEVNSFVDVAAPGGLITSLMARSAVATDDCRTNASSYNMGSSARLVYVGPHDCIFGDGSANGALFTNESGTSFSAPMVAGAAALAKQKWPALTSDQFEQLVRATADDDASGNGYDPVYGAGTLNLARLLAFNFPPEIPSGSAAFTHPVVTTSGADTTQLLAKVNNMEGASDISTITADLSGLGLGSAVAMTDTGGLVYSSPVLTIPSTLPPNQYPVTVTARDAAGGQATAVVALQVSAVGDRLPAGGSPSAFAPAGLDVAVAITRPSTKKGRTTQKKSLPISGTIGADVAFVDVNGNAAEIDATAHTWGALVKLKDGKNRVVVTSYDLTRASSDEDSLTITKDAAGLVSASGSPSRLTSPLEKLRANGVVNSADRPNASVTRAEFAKMLVLTFGKTAQQGSLPADVPVSHSLAKFITTVVKLGWASGNNGRFSPDQPISRMEAARMLLRAAGWKASSEEFFSDLTGAEDRIATTLRTHGVVAGLNGRFEPFRQLTRSEAATILIAASTK
jgi:subtilisin family serine protease